MKSKELANLSDNPYSVFMKLYDSDDENQLQYYKDMIATKQKEIDDMQTLIKKANDQYDYTKALLDFKNLFMLECPQRNFIKINIIHCTDRINKHMCNNSRALTCINRIKLLRQFAVQL